MNLICFPHYTCGGLLCDIFNNTFSAVGANGGIRSIAHSLGKIGDSNDIHDSYDPNILHKQLEKIRVEQWQWIGTHCHPVLLDITKFDKVLLITTTTFKSKLYRWIRAYHHYYYNSIPWKNLMGIDRIDKERETAKSYLKPFLPMSATNVINIEFAEVVETSIEFTKLIGDVEFDKHVSRWKSLNNFLYDSDIWQTTAVKRFYEAELEANLNTHYLYE